jgi:NAD(P)-dependent dehydrogenase (short-subunit alcohol dehydrogenase family)/acyl carrier protein
VRFADQVEVMYSAGARIFIEVGPGEVLTRLVTENLGDRPHLALPTAGRGGRDVETFLRALAQLYTAGHDVDDGRLYRGRRVSPIDLSEATKAARDPLPGHMWLVNGSYSRPAMEPPRVLRPKVASFGTEFAGTLEQDAPGMARAPEERALSAISAGSMQDAAGVMTQYLEMMRGFVEGQRSVMEAYLSGGAVSPVLPIPDGARPGLPAGEDAGAPGSSGELRLSNDVEPSGTAAEPEPTESAASPEAVLSAIIAKRTGYPEEMLDPAADLEADLGIDSIKRVEIIALLRRELFPDLAKPPRWFIEKVTSAASMNEICACVRELRETLGADDHSPQEGGRLYDAADHQPELEPEVILRSLVAKRTGYPEEMLEPDADLEADLGIDSIKRVEIIGLLRRSVFPSGFEPPRWFMERMTSALSMNDISAGVRELLAETAESAAPADSAFKDLTPERSEGSPDSPAEAPVVELRAPRCTVEIVESPLAGQNGALGSGMVLVTDDGEGYAEALMSSLRDRGVEPVLVALPHLANAEAAGDYIADLRGGSERITGLVHLLPTREAPQFPGITERQWAVQVDEEVKSLLFLMQALEPELASRTSTGFSILALTTGGGDFEPGNSDESAHPWRGAIAGLLKTAAIEWPRANFRAVDFDARLDCDQVLSELRASHEHVEVGYRHGRRLVQRPFPLELEEEVSGENLLGPESVILVTGGARGITAQVVLELASRTKATLVLLGRSPAPEEEEADETAALVSPDELRSALIQRRVAAGNKATIKEVEKELRELLRDREMRSIFSTLSSSDVRFEYVPCDVRDPDALEAVVADVVDRLGEIDVLIHGAGVIEDKKLVDKSADSFDRVVGTKVDPILTLARVLDLERLRLTVLFSSIAGVFGNAGQGDYAAASEILNRFACRLAGRATGRVVSINWGPWIGAGSMVTRDVAGMFAEKGIDLISVTAGREAAWREIACPSSKAVRVIIGGGFWLDGGPDGEPGRESNGKVHGRLNGDAMLSVELGEADA